MFFDLANVVGQRAECINNAMRLNQALRARLENQPLKTATLALRFDININNS